MRRWIKIICVVSVLLMSMVFINVPSASAQYIPRSELHFAETAKEVDTSPGSSRTLIFNGTLESSCETAYTVELEVDDESDIPSGWSVSISPSAVRHTEGENCVDDITVIVMAPPEESYGAVAVIKIQTYVRRADVGLNYLGGAAQVTVSVKSFYKVSLTSDTPYQQISPGTETYFYIKIVNLGNLNDLFRIEISNIDSPEFTGWVIQPQYSLVNITEKGTKTVPIKIITPHDWTLWNDKVSKIDINVTSTTSQGVQSSQEISEDFHIYLRQRGTYIPGFDPFFLILCLGIVAIILRKKR